MISVIIPVYNEEGQVGSTIHRLRKKDTARLISEIIVADGGSSDRTVAEAADAGAYVVSSPKKGRAAQMNYGASMAKSRILYFLHADTQPPENFTRHIVGALHKKYHCGCFMLSFDHAHWFLTANCWFTRFDVNAVRFGDQSLFVSRSVFQQAGGFDETHIVMEDQEIIKRLKKHGRFIVIKKSVVTSARKYLVNGVYKTQGIFFIIYLMYYLGYSQQQLVSMYRKLMLQDKV